MSESPLILGLGAIVNDFAVRAVSPKSQEISGGLGPWGFETWLHFLD